MSDCKRFVYLSGATHRLPFFTLEDKEYDEGSALDKLTESGYTIAEAKRYLKELPVEITDE